METILTKISIPNIVFDLDGTLVDSAPSLWTAGNQLLQNINRPSVDLQTYKTFIGKGIRNQVEMLLLHTGGIPDNNLAKYLSLYSSFYNANLLTSTTVYCGVHETLAELKMLPAQLALCTQKVEQSARAVLSGLNIMHYFDGFAFGDSLSVLKPDPEMIFFALRKFEPGPVIYIGDSETDAMTAKNAKVPFLIYSNGYRNSPLKKISYFAKFDYHTEIPHLIKKILSDH